MLITDDLTKGVTKMDKTDNKNENTIDRFSLFYDEQDRSFKVRQNLVDKTIETKFDNFKSAMDFYMATAIFEANL